MLYIIPTPIGNLEDITFRAVRILNEVDLIIAEDTRVSSKLLKHYKIETTVQSYHQHNEHKKTEIYVQEILGGKKIALISDAGTPAISDPGFLIVREAIKHNIRVECLPGATAFVPALVMSGLPSDKFVFEGFLPHKKGRNKRLEIIINENRTIILYESPYRIIKTLEQLSELCGDKRKVAVVRELSKLHEEVVRGNLPSTLLYFKENEPKGEFVIILEGKV